MNIDSITIGEAKKILQLLGSLNDLNQAKGLNDMVGKKVIIRTYSAGVWFGKLSKKSGNEVILTDARRMWRWWTKESISLSSVAIHGINQEKSKIAQAVSEQWLEAVEITPCANESINSIEGCPNAKSD